MAGKSETLKVIGIFHKDRLRDIAFTITDADLRFVKLAKIVGEWNADFRWINIRVTELRQKKGKRK